MRTKIPIHRVNRYIPQCDVCDSISSQSTTTPETTPPCNSCIVWIFSGKYNYTTQWKHIFNTSPSISMTQYHPTFVTVKKHLTTLRTTSYSTHQVFPNPQPLNNIIIHSFASNSCFFSSSRNGRLQLVSNDLLVPCSLRYSLGERPFGIPKYRFQFFGRNSFRE